LIYKRLISAFEFEATVIDEKTSKRKLPAHATGNCIYLSVSGPGVLSEDINTYRKQYLSSNARHEPHFAPSEPGRQANVHVRYSNQHGKEGTAVPTETFFINQGGL
jgi:hypothetical protein